MKKIKIIKDIAALKEGETIEVGSVGKLIAGVEEAEAMVNLGYAEWVDEPEELAPPSSDLMKYTIYAPVTEKGPVPQLPKKIGARRFPNTATMAFTALSKLDAIIDYLAARESLENNKLNYESNKISS